MYEYSNQYNFLVEVKSEVPLLCYFLLESHWPDNGTLHPAMNATLCKFTLLSHMYKLLFIYFQNFTYSVLFLFFCCFFLHISSCLDHNFVHCIFFFFMSVRSFPCNIYIPITMSSPLAVNLVRNHTWTIILCILLGILNEGILLLFHIIINCDFTSDFVIAKTTGVSDLNQSAETIYK